MIRITITTLLFSLIATLASSCSPKPPPVQSVKDIRSDEVKKALPTPAPQPVLVGVPEDKDNTKNQKIETHKGVILKKQIFNQLLARGDESTDVDELAKRIEEVTGAKVEKIRKGALGLLQIRFEATDPPRDEAAQKALVEQVKNMDGLKSVEPERLMFPRENAPSK